MVLVSIIIFKIHTSFIVPLIIFKLMSNREKSCPCTDKYIIILYALYSYLFYTLCMFYDQQSLKYYENYYLLIILHALFTYFTFK